MKHIFILDENILVSACTGKNAHGEDDYSSCNLLLQIARNCHKIGWNNELRKGYIRKTKSLSRRKKQSLFMQAHRIFFHLLTTRDKNLQNQNYLTLDPDLRDDRHIVSLAVFTDGILVTEDGRLKTELGKRSLISKHRLRIVEPKEALQLAGET